jgi:hypothetical protein
MKINIAQILLHRLDEAKLHNGKSRDFHSLAKLLVIGLSRGKHGRGM